jgi:hypothetical protein
MNANEPTAWIRDDGVIAFYPKIEVDSQGFKWFPLYLQPQKYCPSEDNAAYEKGVIDGMAKMTESVVHRAVEGMEAKELTTMEVMVEHCTCYKLGYSVLNNYTKVKDELLTKGEVK